MHHILVLMDKGFNIGGVEMFTLRLVRACRNENVRYSLGYTADGPLRAQYLELDVPLFKYAEGNRFYKKYLKGKLPLLNPLLLVKPVRNVVRFIAENSVSLLQTNGIFSYIVGALAARISGVPMIRMQGNVMSSIEKKHFRFFHLLPFARWTSRYVYFVDAQERDFQKLAVKPAKLFHIDGLGVDMEQFHPGLSGAALRKEFNVPPQAVVVGQIGRLSKNKRFDFMIRVARLVVDQAPQTIFFVVGDGPEREKLETLTASLKLGKNVFFTGFRMDTPMVTAAFDIALFTMADTAGGVANWEAMACGKPVVCTKNEIIRDGLTGFNVDSHREDLFADAVLALVMNPLLAKKMGMQGRKESEERYDFLKCFVPRMQRLYAELAVKNKAGKEK